ncbi:MAG: methyltransferase [Gemmatimonadota bacterium]
MGPDPDALTPDGLRQLASSFQGCRVLLTAFELDLFTALGDGPRTAAQVAAACGADPRATDRLLHALVALGLLHHRGDTFANPPAVDAHLVRGRPGFFSGLGHTAHLWHSWTGLTEAVRRGGTPAGAIDDRGEEWLAAFIAAMHDRARRTAPDLVACFDLDGVTRVLDVGGGSGVYSLAFVRARAGISATVFDLPNVVPLTRRYVAEAGLTDRVDTATGDYNTDPLPGGYDLVFLSAIVHGNSPAQNADLVAKCAAALRPGGRVAVVDFIMDEDRAAPAFGALFALNMLVATAAGDTYTEREVRAWMEGAGLGAITRRGTPFGTGLVVGRRSPD